MLYEGKRILVLGGSFQHCKVVEAAHQLGMIVYVTDYLENSPAKKMADVSLMYDVKDIDCIVKFCKKENIDGVINTSLDPCQIPYQKICEQLELPCFGTAKQFQVLTDKNLFKEYCKKNNVNVIESYTLDELEIRRKNNCIKDILPVLVKPSDSRGSRGQTICYDENMLNTAIAIAKMESSSKKVVVEKYMKNGRDFTVAYLIMNGEVVLVRTGDRYVGSEKEDMSKVAIASISPSKYSKIYLDNVHEKVVHMLKEIGIENGPVFFQGFIEKETVHFYDPGFRFSGGEYEKLLLKATNIDLIQLLVQFAIKGEFEKNIKENDISDLNGMKVVQLCPILKPGRIQTIRGVEEIKKHKNVVTFSEKYLLGDIIPECNDVRRRYAEIGILCKNKKEEIETIMFIQNKLVIEDMERNNLICDGLDLRVI